jgi:hypothetical protein
VGGMVFTRVDETHTIQVGTHRVGFVDHKHAGFPDKTGMKHWTITRIELGPFGSYRSPVSASTGSAVVAVSLPVLLLIAGAIVTALIWRRRKKLS